MKELSFKLFRFGKQIMDDMNVIVEGRDKVKNPVIKLNKKLATAIAVLH